MPPATAIDQIPALLAQADQLRQQAATLQPEVDRLQRRIDRLSADITDLESQLIEPPLTNRDAKKNARLRERIADIQARRDGIQQQLDPLLAEQSSLLDQADVLTAQADQRQTEATALQTQATQLRANATQYDANAQQEDTLALQAETQAAEYRRLAQDNPPAEPVETHFIYNSDGQLIYEHDNRTGKTVEYLYLDATPIAFIRDGQLYFIHTDHLGTPRMVTDNTQRTVWEWYSTPFGVNATNEDVDGDGTKVTLNLRFAGQYFDQETGLHYNYFRDYDPSTGRYRESDPIGLKGGLNPYIYTFNNPLRWTDPLGLYTEIIVWQPYGWGGSSFGHVSANINGQNYSFGPNGWDSRASAADYINRQTQFRSGVGVVLNLTPEQEAQLEACLKKSNGNYDAVTDNCGTPYKDCLASIGVDIGYPLFPPDIGDALLNSPLNIGITGYQGPTRGFFDNIGRGDLPDAPWAR